MNSTKYTCLAILLAAFLNHSNAIDCYQCSGDNPNEPFQCNEWLDGDIDIKPQPCDNVYDAKYCVKHIGRYEGYVSAINCYQCAASATIDCSDGMIHMGGLKSTNCSHVFEAEYCIKSTSLDGGIGAKRFCSSLNLGNYCNYVKQPGDKLTYRTCVFTCTGDGCNSATKYTATSVSLTIATVVAAILYLYSVEICTFYSI